MNEKKTLLVLCFSMGTWIAGTLVTASSVNYANAGNPVSVLTPGIEKMNALDIVKRLGDSYDQIVLGGYPPFVKDVIEEGIRGGIDWKKQPVKLVMGGEAFSEEWRDYVLDLVGSDDPYFATANIFGAADIGVVANETPFSIAVRRMYGEHPGEAKSLFGTEVLPSIEQYDPTKRFFEKVGDELVVTSRSGIPLARYNLKDTGGILTASEMTSPLASVITAKAESVGINSTEWSHPFVYLNGRKDFCLSVYGVNVYPENIKAALIEQGVREVVTGRFTMATTNTETMDQSFAINIELAKEVEATDEDKQRIAAAIKTKLTSLNSEFRKLYDAVGDKVLPEIQLITFGDQNYFARGVKHRWTKKEK